MNSTEDVGSPQQNRSIWGKIIPILVISVIGLFAFLFFSRLSGTPRLIKPFAPTQTPFALQVEYAPIALEFADLGEDPLQYRDQRVRITGRFSKIESPDCAPYSGPQIQWGLLNDSLQMNAIGYETVVRSLSDNTEMTVEGVWTFYDGGVGCGKEPTEQNGVWYLKVEHILSPNPILANGPSVQTRTNVEDNPDSEATPTDFDATPVDEDDGAVDEIITPTTQPDDESVTPTLTPTRMIELTPTSTPINTSPNATATSTPEADVTPTTNATPAPDSTETAVPTATAISDEETSTPTPTATTSSPGAPPAATATPGGGYPPPGGGGYP